MPVTLEQVDALSLIRLEGAIGIGCAAELKRLLLLALGSGREVRVSRQEAADLDVTAVQLLWAAARQAQASGAGFSFAGPISKDLSAALSEAGLQQFLDPVDAR